MPRKITKPGPEPLTSKLLTKTRMSRRVIRFSIPGEASVIFDDHLRKLSGFYANEREFCESVVAYALWCKREHHLTGPSFKTRELRARMWAEIIADYKKPSSTGSFFEHRLEEIANRRKQ